jgi:hypothetical protein
MLSPLRFGVSATALAFCAVPLATLLAALLAPRPAVAQAPVAVPPGACCQTCRMPAGSCTHTTMHPVVQTQYRQEQVVSYHQVNRVALKQEAYCVTVPKTQVYNVTRDEGCYQMVWVPKPVTRQYSQTTYEQQTKCRTVPVHYTECVPKVCTQVVPEQKVCYVPVTTTKQLTMDVTTCVSPPVCPAPVCPPPVCPPPVCPAPVCAPTCAAPVPTCAAPAAVFAPPHPTAQPLPPGLQPLGAYNPSPNLVPNPQHLEPPAAGNYNQWSTVPGHQTVQYSQYAAARPQATATGRPIQIPANAAPSAATVWQTRGQ